MNETINATTTAGTELQNASADMTAAFGDASGIALPGIIIVVYIVGALLAAQFIAPWLAQSDTLERFAGGLAHSLVYAIKGAAASAVLLVIATPAYFALTMDAGTRGLALRGIALLLGGYVVLNVVGWLADRAVGIYIDAHPTAEEWADLWPETEQEGDGL